MAVWLYISTLANNFYIILLPLELKIIFAIFIPCSHTRATCQSLPPFNQSRQKSPVSPSLLPSSHIPAKHLPVSLFLQPNHRRAQLVPVNQSELPSSIILLPIVTDWIHSKIIYYTTKVKRELVTQPRHAMKKIQGWILQLQLLSKKWCSGKLMT